MAAWAWDHYHIALVPLGFLALAVAWLTRPKADDDIPDGFRSFQSLFLPVWCLCAAADWLQGPYGWEVLESYGFEYDIITDLFGVGYASSLVVSFFIGAVADVFGRKRVCILFCVANIVNCFLIRFKSLPLLFLGKCISGISTPILYTIFEVWMVSEHKQRHRFSSKLLSYNFSLMFLGMYSVAIVCGLVSQAAVVGTGTQPRPIGDSELLHGFGYIIPFDITIGLMLVGAPLIACLWPENYGTSAESSGVEAAEASRESRSMKDTLSTAWRVMRADVRIPLITFGGAFFEGAMYSFVTQWTPALKSEKIEPFYPPSGVVFSAFMMCAMIGAAVATFMDGFMSAKARLAAVYAIGAITHFGTAVSTGGDHPRVTFFIFLVFEFCVGIYFPTNGMVRQDVVPEHCRAAVYSVERIVMNSAVLAILFSGLSLQASFWMSGSLMCVSVCCCLALIAIDARRLPSEEKEQLSPKSGEGKAIEFS